MKQGRHGFQPLSQTLSEMIQAFPVPMEWPRRAH
jgi:hypothetical protein